MSWLQWLFEFCFRDWLRLLDWNIWFNSWFLLDMFDEEIFKFFTEFWIIQSLCELSVKSFVAFPNSCPLHNCCKWNFHLKMRIKKSISDHVIARKSLTWVFGISLSLPMDDCIIYILLKGFIKFIWFKFILMNGRRKDSTNVFEQNGWSVEK